MSDKKAAIVSLEYPNTAESKSLQMLNPMFDETVSLRPITGDVEIDSIIRKNKIKELNTPVITIANPQYQQPAMAQ